MFSAHMLNGLFDPIINWFSAAFYYLSVGVYYLIVCGVGKLVDIIQLLFRKFAGLDGMSLAGGEEGDIVMQFINSSIVQQVFLSMVILAIVLIFITSFVAVIKTEFDKEGKNSKRKVIKNAFRGIANFLIVPIVCIFGLIVGNALLRTIDAALTATGDTMSMTSQIFVAGGYNSNRVRKYEGTGDNASGYQKGSMASWITGGEKNGVGYGSFGVFYDDETGIVKQTAADKIDNAFANNITIDLTKLTTEEKTLVYANGNSSEYAYSYLNNFTLGAFPWGHTSFNWTGDDGVRGVTLGDEQGLIKEGTTITFSVYNVGLVSYYYDLSLFTYDYLIAGISLAFAAWVYIVTLLGLIKRLFMITTLFIISPPVCALYPLDGGKALEGWRKEFIKQAISAYSVVIILNIFFLLLPLFLQIQIIPVGVETTLSGGGLSSGLINYIARVLIIIGALTFFKDATKTISDIIGSGSAYGDGSSATKKFGENVKRTAVGTAMVAGGLGAVGKFIGGLGKGGKNQMNDSDIDKTAQSDALSGSSSSDGKAKGDATKTKNTNSMNKSGSSKKGKVASVLRNVGLGLISPVGMGMNLASKGIGKGTGWVKNKVTTAAATGNGFAGAVVGAGRAARGAASDIGRSFGKTFNLAEAIVKGGKDLEKVKIKDAYNYLDSSDAEKIREARIRKYNDIDATLKNTEIGRLKSVQAKARSDFGKQGYQTRQLNQKIREVEKAMEREKEADREKYKAKISDLQKENEEIKRETEQSKKKYHEAKKKLDKINKTKK